MTGYVKINSASDSDFDLTWYSRGGHHNSDEPCEGTSYKGGLFKDGRSRFAKEQWHSGGYSFTPAQKNIDSIEDKWIGYKAIMYNTVVNGEPAVKLENWVDENIDGKMMVNGRKCLVILIAADSVKMVIDVEEVQMN